MKTINSHFQAANKTRRLRQHLLQGGIGGTSEADTFPGSANGTANRAEDAGERGGGREGSVICEGRAKAERKCRMKSSNGRSRLP